MTGSVGRQVCQNSGRRTDHPLGPVLGASKGSGNRPVVQHDWRLGLGGLPLMSSNGRTKARIGGIDDVGGAGGRSQQIGFLTRPFPLLRAASCHGSGMFLVLRMDVCGVCIKKRVFRS